MKTLTICMVLCSLLATACEKANTWPDVSEGFCLVSDDGVVLNHKDIEYYDFSTHMIYLKDHISFTEDILESGVNAVYAEGEKIYDLAMMNPWDSYMPSGPLLWNWSYYGDFVVLIDLLHPGSPEDAADPREDIRVAKALLRYEQFHHGLACEIVEIRRVEAGHLELELELRNEDVYPYLYPDPEKMGSALYHYFTNGLSLRNAEDVYYYHEMVPEVPDPKGEWNPDWLSVIGSGANVRLTSDYPHFNEVPPGEYTAWFRFPGENYHLTRDDLVQEQGRIWMGYLNLEKTLTID
ncbi:MAG: hypothetical protein E4H10_05120 [Bacteroidia bacterium]|nr:MAG: hypothetical protein E4H10_05120 [Bacteroidia bacterium]